MQRKSASSKNSNVLVRGPKSGTTFDLEKGLAR